MGKKLSILTLTALTLLGGTTLSTASVSAAQEWTFSEVLENKIRHDAIVDELCHYERECEKSYYKNLARENSYGLVTTVFNERILLVTSINPSTLTLRVLFNDRSYLINPRTITETGPHDAMEKLEISWSFRDSEGSIDYESESPLTPYEETEIVLADADSLGHAMATYLDADITTEHTISGNSIDFKKCINSPLYREGMECQIRFPESGSPYYTPVWPLGVEPAPEEDHDKENQGNTGGDTHQPEIPSESEHQTNPIDPSGQGNETSPSSPDPDLESKDPSDSLGQSTSPKPESGQPESPDQTQSPQSPQLPGESGDPGEPQLPQLPKEPQLALASSPVQSLDAASTNPVNLPSAPNTGSSHPSQFAPVNAKFNHLLGWVAILAILDFALFLAWLRQNPQKSKKNLKKSPKTLDKS